MLLYDHPLLCSCSISLYFVSLLFSPPLTFPAFSAQSAKALFLSLAIGGLTILPSSVSHPSSSLAVFGKETRKGWDRFVSETPIFMGPLLGFARKLAGWFPSLFSAFVTVIHNSLLPFGFGFPVLVFSVLSQTVATITVPSFVRDPKPFPCAYLWKLIHSPSNTANVCPRLCSRDG